MFMVFICLFFGVIVVVVIIIIIIIIIITHSCGPQFYCHGILSAAAMMLECKALLSPLISLATVSLFVFFSVLSDNRAKFQKGALKPAWQKIQRMVSTAVLLQKETSYISSYRRGTVFKKLVIFDFYGAFSQKKSH